ncbi:Rep family protein [Listeria sp. ILCC792]|uniref:Rep family protein n=1 Tax=Listeria sp. ILCC792 TaxID=1918331 RepID=UPI00135632CD|nr:Rep family protein [Listeria sp. ILCC792]
MATLRAVNVMYEQQLQHLPKSIKRKTITSIFKTLINQLQPVKIAGIIHDKDTNENGEPIEKHVHVVLQFKNPRSLEKLAKLINEPQVSSFQQWRGNVNNAYSYLIHRTNEAQEKYQYAIEEVKANFDYPALMNTISKKVTQRGLIKDNEIIRDFLDRLGTGELSKEEVISNLTGSQFAKAKKQINDVHQQVQAEKAKIWLTNRKNSGEPITVIWIYGNSETGKTVLAKKYASAEQKNYFITGSSKDSFQHYEGEHIVILDELRPKTFPYDDLLKMLDPYGENPKAPSRFFDKSLMVDLFIITSPYSPKQFYDEIFGCKKTIDSFKQLQRRITFVQFMTLDYFEMQEYNFSLQTYIPVLETKQKNNLVATLKQHNVHNGKAIYQKFNDLFDNKERSNLKNE